MKKGQRVRYSKKTNSLYSGRTGKVVGKVGKLLAVSFRGSGIEILIPPSSLKAI